jgi:radical SAM protein with 4Fe4S-binding SPASM domain
MKDNYHQFNDMVKLAKSLSPHYRIGAPWLYLSADKEKNNEISSQRLPPCEVFLLDTPDMNRNEYEDKISDKSDYLFSSCIKKRGEFHIDPYGKMTFCSFIKDRDLRYDLRKGSFKDCWDNFIPSLKYKIKTNNEYRENCGDCDLRKHCRWCPAYGYLEHGRYTAKVDYLCKVAKENKKFKEEWIKNHRRFYKCADITIEVDSDLPFTDNTFHDKIKVFQTDGKGNDRIKIKHSFSMPELKEDMGKEVYRKPPWAIYRKNSSWIYMSISPVKEDRNTGTVAVFNNDHTSGVIYNRSEDMFLEGSLQSLTLFPTDQLLLARILPDREGFYLHSSGVVMNGKGFAFAGHSGAGKSTMVKMLSDRAEILCDDRNIIRRHNDGFYLYGTWSHGEIPSVSPGPAPLRGIYFLEKSEENNIISLYDKKEIVKRLLPCIIKPFVTSDWWEKTLTVIEKVSSEVPCYILRFDKSGKIVEKLL